MSRWNPATSLAVARVAVGAGTWAAPRLAGRTFGLDPDANPGAPYLARLFGVRDAAVGLGILTSSGDARRRWVLVGAACDAADAVAGVAGGRAGYLSKPASARVTAGALGGVALGIAALRDAR